LPDRRLDVGKLLTAFQEFFREHSEHWVERFDYKEAGPQLLLQAFLQRIVNSRVVGPSSEWTVGGRVEREYGLGRKRTDLLLLWPYGDRQVQKVVIEVKVVSGSLERTVAEGVVQTWEYLDRCGAEEGHVVVFNLDPSKSWEEKIFRRTEEYHGRSLEVWGM